MEARETIVTASDAAYFRCLEQLLASLARTQARRPRTMVFDLGMEAGQRRRLLERWPWAELHRHDLAAAPAFMRITARATNSNAWKPQIVRDVVERAAGPVLWLDSATVALRDLAAIWAFIRRTGLYTPFGGHSPIARWTSPATAERLGAGGDALSARMRASGVFGALPSHAVARALVAAWADACQDEGCVAPRGATRDRHNFDQSVMNLLLLRAHAEHRLELTRDELDISSTRPTTTLRTRNKVHRAVPLALDPMVRAWFALARTADVQVLRMRRSPRCPEPLRDIGAPSAW